eukprot:gene8317-11252_t
MNISSLLCEQLDICSSQSRARDLVKFINVLDRLLRISLRQKCFIPELTLHLKIALEIAKTDTEFKDVLRGNINLRLLLECFVVQYPDRWFKYFMSTADGCRDIELMLEIDSLIGNRAVHNLILEKIITLINSLDFTVELPSAVCQTIIKLLQFISNAELIRWEDHSDQLIEIIQLLARLSPFPALWITQVAYYILICANNFVKQTSLIMVPSTNIYEKIQQISDSISIIFSHNQTLGEFEIKYAIALIMSSCCYTMDSLISELMEMVINLTKSISIKSFDSLMLVSEGGSTYGLFALDKNNTKSSKHYGQLFEFVEKIFICSINVLEIHFNSLRITQDYFHHSIRSLSTCLSEFLCAEFIEKWNDHSQDQSEIHSSLLDSEKLSESQHHQELSEIRLIVPDNVDNTQQFSKLKISFVKLLSKELQFTQVNASSAYALVNLLLSELFEVCSKLSSLIDDVEVNDDKFKHTDCNLLLTRMEQLALLILSFISDLKFQQYEVDSTTYGELHKLIIKGMMKTIFIKTTQKISAAITSIIITITYQSDLHIEDCEKTLEFFSVNDKKFHSCTDIDFVEVGNDATNATNALLDKGKSTFIISLVFILRTFEHWVNGIKLVAEDEDVIDSIDPIIDLLGGLVIGINEFVKSLTHSVDDIVIVAAIRQQLARLFNKIVNNVFCKTSLDEILSHKQSPNKANPLKLFQKQSNNSASSDFEIGYQVSLTVITAIGLLLDPIARCSELIQYGSFHNPQSQIHSNLCNARNEMRQLWYMIVVFRLKQNPLYWVKNLEWLSNCQRIAGCTPSLLYEGNDTIESTLYTDSGLRRILYISEYEKEKNENITLNGIFIQADFIKISKKLAKFPLEPYISSKSVASQASSLGFFKMFFLLTLQFVESLRCGGCLDMRYIITYVENPKIYLCNDMRQSMILILQYVSSVWLESATSKLTLITHQNYDTFLLQINSLVNDQVKAIIKRNATEILNRRRILREAVYEESMRWFILTDNTDELKIDLIDNNHNNQSIHYKLPVDCIVDLLKFQRLLKQDESYWHLDYTSIISEQVSNNDLFVNTIESHNNINNIKSGKDSVASIESIPQLLDFKFGPGLITIDSFVDNNYELGFNEIKFINNKHNNTKSIIISNESYNNNNNINNNNNNNNNNNENYRTRFISSPCSHIISTNNSDNLQVNLLKQESFGFNMTSLKNNNTKSFLFKKSNQLNNNIGFVIIMDMLILQSLDQLITWHDIGTELTHWIDTKNDHNYPIYELRIRKDNNISYIQNIKKEIENINKINNYNIHHYKQAIKSAWIFSSELAIVLTNKFPLFATRDGQRKGVCNMMSFIACNPRSIQNNTLSSILITETIQNQKISYDEKSNCIHEMMFQPTLPVHLSIIFLNRYNFNILLKDSLLLVTPGNIIPSIVRYTIRCMNSSSNESLVFLLPQIIQLLRRDEYGILSEFIHNLSVTSRRLCHYLVWLLQVEIGSQFNIHINHHQNQNHNNNNNNKSHHSSIHSTKKKTKLKLEINSKHGFCNQLIGIDPLPELTQTLLFNIRNSMIYDDLYYLDIENNLFNKLTEISGELHLIKNKKIHSNIIQEKVENIWKDFKNEYEYDMEGIYMPTNPFRKELFEDGCIFKVHDDCRQDMLTIQVVKLLQFKFRNSNIPIFLRAYNIIPIRCGADLNLGGILEFIPNVKSRDEIGKSYLIKKNQNISLLDYYIDQFGAADGTRFRNAQLAFVSSLAGYAILCYILNIKDRHNGNILIDEHGHLIHIDYGFILGISPGGNIGFETAAFKFTKEMADLMNGIIHNNNNTNNNNSNGNKDYNNNSETFQLFRDLTIRGFLATREIMIPILNIVCGYADSDLPCFKYKDDVLRKLRDRFVPTMSSSEAAKHMSKCIDNALNKWTTNGYDVIQKMQNDIYH